MNYFIFNKASDYKRGYGENSQYNENSLWIKNTEISSIGYFFSRILDSKEKGTNWHRMVMESESFGDAFIQFYFYQSDSLTAGVEEKGGSIENIIHNSSIVMEEKKKILQPYLVKKVLNPTDILLHDVEGRYLWFLIELYAQGKNTPIVKNLKIFFPKQSWVQYLPGIYQENTFLERYLGIFQTLYEDLESSIRNNAQNLEPQMVNYDFLQWLASWLNIKYTHVWQEEKLRKLLENGMELYKKRGTRQGLIDIVKLYTGVEPFVVEYHQTEAFSLDNLYGKDSNIITLLLQEEFVSSETAYYALMNIIEEVKPAHTEVKIIALKPNIFLNYYSYVGVNSILGYYRPLSLDGLSVLSFTTVNKNT